MNRMSGLYRMSVRRVLLFTVLCSLAIALYPGEPDHPGMEPIEGFHYSAEIGATLRFDPSFGAHSLSVPFLSGAIGGNGFVYVNLFGELDFGAQFKYFDILSGLNFLILPFKEFLGIRFGYALSSGLSILNNYGHVMEAALDLEIPLLFKDSHFCLEAGGFWRLSVPILGYLGSGSFYGSSCGWMVSLSYRWRGLAPVSMPQLP